jgi:hypothetical protein
MLNTLHGRLSEHLGRQPTLPLTIAAKKHPRDTAVALE